MRFATEHESHPQETDRTMASRIQTRAQHKDLSEINRALQLVDRGNHLQASTICNRLLKKHPKVPAIWGVLSAAQVGMRQFNEARRSAQKGLKLNPKSVDIRIRLGMVFTAEHRFAEAAREYEHALRLAPGNLWATRALADAKMRLGLDEEAHALLLPHMSNTPIETRLAMIYLRTCLKTGRIDEGLAMIKPLTANESMAPVYKSQSHFLIGELLAKAGRHDEAMEAYHTANTSAGHAFDPARHRAGIDRVIGAWTPEAIASLQRPVRKTDRFVFIVGMPRSGTSLVEQIIASHPRAFGCGELDFINEVAARFAGSRDGWAYLDDLDRLTPAALDQAAQRYSGLMKQIAPGADLVTDKMPSNAMQLGLISAMLPQAQVINCVRDPRDTCLSCYTNHFLGRGNVFTHDLAWLGDYYTEHQRLMRHWKRVLDLPILDVVYEDLVADEEAQIRRLIDFLGLDWDDRCLRFHATRRTTKTNSAQQVTQPMYSSSVGRWKQYEKHLGPLLERLPAGSQQD